MVRYYGIYASRSKSISTKILQGCKRFIQITIEFITNDSKSLRNVGSNTQTRLEEVHGC
ncbi:MAG: hypothetical protein HGJ96_08835 [Desulfobacteraceae bacterium]|nr:hypothetical protein [Desulfobacteraceae bacterium]